MPSDAILRNELQATLTRVDAMIAQLKAECAENGIEDPYLLGTTGGEFPFIGLMTARSNALLGLAILSSEKRARFVNRT